MTRLVTSTCGILFEAVACQSASSVESFTFAMFGLAAAATAWWTTVNPLLDRLVGIDSTSLSDESLANS
ncbi:hypothetical protein [Rubinisphaera sp. JC750]|uniref:hypothetical protein n=1 Tax=Rubinisphaera sp. JC750 TaxID=2898658 RepID=UPI001F1B16BA|nr:hypothetical protein [Rubinisphaera sp. JC750]